MTPLLPTKGLLANYNKTLKNRETCLRFSFVPHARKHIVILVSSRYKIKGTSIHVNPQVQNTNETSESSHMDPYLNVHLSDEVKVSFYTLMTHRKTYLRVLYKETPYPNQEIVSAWKKMGTPCSRTLLSGGAHLIEVFNDLVRLNPCGLIAA